MHIRIFIVVATINAFLTFDLSNYFDCSLIILSIILGNIQLFSIIIYVKMNYNIRRVPICIAIIYYSMFTYIATLYVISSVFRGIEKIINY